MVVSDIISNLNTIKEENGFFFQFVFLFGQIGVEKLQNLLFKIIWFHIYIYIYIYISLRKKQNRSH